MGKWSVDRSIRWMLTGVEHATEPMEVKTKREDRYALRQHLARAKELVARFVDICRRDDPMEQAIVGSELSDELQALWNVRRVREEAWAQVLNFLQSALAQEEFERFQSSYCTAVQKVVVDYLAGGGVDPEAVVRVRMILREVGLDPWKGVSSLDE